VTADKTDIILCRTCSAVLTDDNRYDRHKRENRKLCKGCAKIQYKEIQGGEKYRYHKKRELYYVGKSHTSSAPTIRLRDKGKDKRNFPNIIREMADDTEQFRVDQLFKLMMQTTDIGERINIIATMLKGNVQLTLRKSSVLINVVNGLIQSNEIPGAAKLVLIVALRAYAGKKAKVKAKVKTKMYEEILAESSMIEVDIP